MIPIHPESLGDPQFLLDHGVKYAYVAGSMVHAISSPELVIRMGNARMLSFLGTGGLSIEKTEACLKKIKESLGADKPWGANLLCNLDHPASEEATVELLHRYQVRRIEASAFMQMTRGLVLYRLRGLRELSDGSPQIMHHVMAKISRPEVARQFLLPPPQRIVQQLLLEGKITAEEARIAKRIPMADDICVEADSGGHTDQGVAFSLVPAIMRLRDNISLEQGYPKRIRVGAAGGLSTPESIASAFILGADFVLTGSINQSTVEAGTSSIVKQMLQDAEPQDTAIAPAGDMFEIGAKIQVLSKGLFFPSRANKLYDLYRSHSSLDEIDARTRLQIQDKFFHKSFEEVYNICREYYAVKNPGELEKMEKNLKHRMAKIFRWYFSYSNRIALQGVEEDRVNFQISCGPAIGSFNYWVKGTELAHWEKRHVDQIGELLMHEAARVLQRKLSHFTRSTHQFQPIITQ